MSSTRPTIEEVPVMDPQFVDPKDKTRFYKLPLPQEGEPHWGIKINRIANFFDQELMMHRLRLSGNWNHTEEAIKQCKKLRRDLLFVIIIGLIEFIVCLILILGVVKGWFG